MEKVRSLLHASKLGYEFWAKAVVTSIYLENRSPTVAVKGKTPYEVWFGKKPFLYNLQIFRCIAYAYIPDEKQTKLDWKSRKCIFLGYSGSNQYQIWDPEQKKLHFAKDVIFDKSNIIKDQIDFSKNLEKLSEPELNNNLSKPIVEIDNTTMKSIIKIGNSTLT